ncbi:hypothetical protein FA13DRAFT_1656842 [Coprinellus micaceus]|uniref:Fungal-type protein kinase domain-containing protein n=1 Tax=Coprinellus micaceus TaxID=71717 RepID=A0A4Y7TUK3_COPMI|nr:hypothetical protein FA13DRAFT_1656842 [Coprinellus micaceus]
MYPLAGFSKDWQDAKRFALRVAQNPVEIQRPSYTTTSDAYAHELYQDVVEPREVEAFLHGVDYYSVPQGRWTTPNASTRPETLVNSIFNIIRSIVGRFANPKDSGVEREVVNTFYAPKCSGTDSRGYRACPTLLVRAAGPSFEFPPPLNPQEPSPDDLGFSNMATYFYIKPELETPSEKEIVDEMESYARQIFCNQPNRVHVRSLTFTENHARLVHFDRAGSQITPPIDIHKNPGTLIRLVAGLSSTDERIMGLDDSVQWTILDGRKAGGSVTTASPSGETKTYPIVERIPTARDSIRGRATTCWRVKDPETGEEYVVKDSWRPSDRSSESELLEVVKGIPGVVEMVSFESCRGEAKDLRCPSTIGQYHNRIATRVTTKSYGPPIYRFTSVVQLLSAIRDAIGGHQRLVSDDIRILHRDISHNNILLGKGGAEKGSRGILIDLDMAFRALDANSTVTADQDVGTRLFQSHSVLMSAYLKKHSPAHDYLDDLESFFYLLAYIFLSYRPDGTPLPSGEEGPSIAWGWSEESASAAQANKRLLFGAGPGASRALRLVEDTWGPVCGTLFDEFRWWVFEKHDEKDELLGGYPSERVPNPLEPLHSHRDEHYAQVLNFFDEAIEAAQGSAPTPAPMHDDAPPPSSPTPLFDTPQPRTPSLPTPPTVPTQCRRSTRIRDLLQAKGGPSSIPIRPSKAPILNQPEQPTTQLRRSARLQKRRLEEEEQLEAPPPKAKRIKKGLRVTIRAR